jgi:hypothetical protein
MTGEANNNQPGGHGSTDPGASALLGAKLPDIDTATVRAEGHAERQALLSDVKFREAFARGDPDAVTKMRSALAKVQRYDFAGNALPEDQQKAREFAEREGLIDAMKRVADINDDVANMIRNQTPVSAAERKLAEQEMARLKADREFCKKYFDGSRAERTRMTLLNVILSAPVAAEAGK